MVMRLLFVVVFHVKKTETKKENASNRENYDFLYLLQFGCERVFTIDSIMQAAKFNENKYHNRKQSRAVV